MRLESMTREESRGLEVQATAFASGEMATDDGDRTAEFPSCDRAFEVSSNKAARRGTCDDWGDMG